MIDKPTTPFANQRAEVYNPTTKTIVFTNIHQDRAVQYLNWQRFKLKPGERKLIPHLAYSTMNEDGTEVPEGAIITSFGRAIGTGATRGDVVVPERT